MALGNFTLTIDGERIGGVAETTARITIKPQNPTGYIKDAAADKFWFQPVSVTASLPYTISLPTDVAAGGGDSTTIGYHVDVVTTPGARVSSDFAAKADGSTVALTDVTETVVIPIADSAAYATQAKASADQAATSATDAAASAQQAKQVAGQWAPSTAYAANQVVLAPDGSLLSRISAGTSRTSFDATEQAAWQTVSSKSGTMEQQALSAAYAAKGTPAGITIGNGRYDPLRAFYTPAGARLTKARSALAKARANTAYSRIVCVGDSTTAGMKVDAASQSYPTFLRKTLAAVGHTIAGTGVVYLANNNGATGRDSRWTVDASWTYFQGHALGSVTSGGTMTFTSDLPGTVVDIYYSNGYTGGFTYSIDGGAAVAAAGDGSHTTGKISVTGLSNATHSVKITTTSTTAVFIIGVDVHNTTGVSVTNAGIGGSRLDPTWDDASSYQNPVYNDTVGITPLPDLAVIMLMTNDAGNTLDVPTYTSHLGACVDLFKNAGADVILMTGVTPTTTPYGSFQALTTSVWSAYRQAAYGVADSKAVPLIDISERFGLYSSANSYGLMADGLHASPPGNALVAQAVAEMLGAQ